MRKLRTLKKDYEACCNEYRRWLCEMWDLNYEDTWWHGDHVGSGLFIVDWWMPLDIEELRYIVENNVTEKDWLEWCAFVESEINNGKDHPRISFWSWMKGARPEMLK